MDEAARTGQIGPLLTIAITIEYLFVGISVAASLGAATARWRVVSVPIGLALLTVAGAVVGVIGLGNAPGVVLTTALAVGAVACMYLVVEELLVRAHEHGESARGSVLFFVWLLIYLVIEEVIYPVRAARLIPLHPLRARSVRLIRAHGGA